MPDAPKIDAESAAGVWLDALLKAELDHAEHIEWMRQIGSQQQREDAIHNQRIVHIGALAKLARQAQDIIGAMQERIDELTVERDAWSAAASRALRERNELLDLCVWLRDENPRAWLTLGGVAGKDDPELAVLAAARHAKRKAEGEEPSHAR